MESVIRALVMASFVTPPFLGAIAWEILAAPNSGLLNQFYRYVTGDDDPVAIPTQVTVAQATPAASSGGMR